MLDVQDHVSDAQIGHKHSGECSDERGAQKASVYGHDQMDGDKQGVTLFVMRISRGGGWFQSEWAAVHFIVHPCIDCLRFERRSSKGYCRDRRAAAAVLAMVSDARTMKRSETASCEVRMSSAATVSQVR